MKKSGSTRHRHTEKAIIDALLKISEIVQKTEASRQAASSQQRLKKTVGDGDCQDSYHVDGQNQLVPVPPPMRTLDSYVSKFNQQASNCNQVSTVCEQNVTQNTEEKSEKDDRLSVKQCADNRDLQEEGRSYKRYYSDASLSSNDPDQQERSWKRRFSYSSFQSDKASYPIREELKTVDNQPTITSVNSPTISHQAKSVVTTIHEDPSLASLPTLSVHPETRKPCASSTNASIEQRLQTTLEQRLKEYLLPAATIRGGNSEQQQRTRSITLSKSETGKLMNGLRPSQQTCNAQHYQKQRELALLAAQDGDYSLSYTIYTSLLLDEQYDHKYKSEVLASRATTLLLDQKCFESIDDCTRAIAFNQWNKLAYIVRAACWMIVHEYSKALEDYSKLFHFFDQSQYVLDLLNLAYEKFKIKNIGRGDEQSAEVEKAMKIVRSMVTVQSESGTVQPRQADTSTMQALSLASPTASFVQPAVYLCYPYQACPTWYGNHQEQPSINEENVRRSPRLITDVGGTPSLSARPSPIFSEQSFHQAQVTKRISSKSMPLNNNAIPSTPDLASSLERQSSSMNDNARSNLLWIENPYRSC